MTNLATPANRKGIRLVIADFRASSDGDDFANDGFFYHLAHWLDNNPSRFSIEQIAGELKNQYNQTKAGL